MQAVSPESDPNRAAPPAGGLCLLTGATGFVGAAVARALLGRGYALRLMVRSSSPRANIAGLPAEIVIGDLTDPASLARAAAGCRYVLHVAADYRIWVPDPAAMLCANVDGTTAMLRAAVAAGAERIVYCSSVAALGASADGRPVTEDTPRAEADMVGTYKRSKFLAEQAARAEAAQGAPVVIVNPAAPVGPRDIKPTPTGRMIRDAARGRIPAYVDTGLNIVHVDDVGLGHVLALERGRIGEAYVLGGENLALARVLAMVAAIVGRRAPRIRLPVGPLMPVAALMEALARLSGTEPMLTRDHLKMARKEMFYASDRAVRELGYAPRQARLALVDAITWFRDAGMLAGVTIRPEAVAEAPPRGGRR